MLTAKQDRFVEGYVVSLNGTQAAIQAGYSPRTARSIASENLRKPEIVAEIDRRSASRRQRDDFHSTRVLEKLQSMAFSNIKDFLDGNRVKHPDEWSQATWDAVKTVTFRQTIEHRKDGTTKRVVEVIGLKLENSIKALDLLGKHLGLFPRGRRSWKKRDSDWQGPYVTFNVTSGPMPRQAPDR